MTAFLSINKCRHGVFSISLDNSDTRTGISLTPTCCERATELVQFPQDAGALRNLITELECALDEAEKNDD